jgi:hypothetical protein
MKSRTRMTRINRIILASHERGKDKLSYRLCVFEQLPVNPIDLSHPCSPGFA